MHETFYIKYFYSYTRFCFCFFFVSFLRNSTIKDIELNAQSQPTAKTSQGPLRFLLNQNLRLNMHGSESGRKNSKRTAK